MTLLIIAIMYVASYLIIGFLVQGSKASKARRQAQ